MGTRSNNSQSCSEEQPNVVLMTADSVRADHCGFLNAEMDTTPTLDKLAEEGVVFENAIAPGPRTPSSMPVIWTGEYVGNENKKVYTNKTEKRSNWQARRDRIRRHLDRFETIAERFQSVGYDTGGITTNPWTDTDTAFQQGFDHFEQIERIPSDRSKTFFRRIINQTSSLSKFPDARRWLLLWTDIYHRILKIREQLTEPYFLWVFLLDTHMPYFSPRKCRKENTSVGMYYANVKYEYSHEPVYTIPDRLEKRLNAAYRDTIRSVDACVSRLLNDLEADDPAFVFHSDHGEAQYEHGTRGHRPELYEENLKVPLLAHNVGETGRVSEQVALRKLPEYLTSIATDNCSAEILQESPTIAKTEKNERTAIRTNEWKRISSSESWYGSKDAALDELYHLGSDPGETNNVFEARKEVAECCDQWLSQHTSSLEERHAISTAATELIEESDPQQTDLVENV